MANARTGGYAAATYDPIDLKRSILLLYSSVGLPLAIIGYPIAIWIPPRYADAELGLTLPIIGTILILARLSDIVTDPLVGNLSDNRPTRWGRRKPWILAGVPVMCLGIYMLFMPPEGAGIVWLLVWVSVMYLGGTLIGVPYGAWGAELSPVYHQRSRVTAVRELFILVGLIVAALIPVLVNELWQPGVDNYLTVMAWTIIGILPISAFVLLRFVPEAPVAQHAKVSFREGVRAMWANGPMRLVLIILFAVTTAEAFRNALTYFFMRDYIGFDVANASRLYASYFFVAVLSVPGWLWLGRRIGKHRAFTIAIVGVTAVSFLTFALRPGDTVPYVLLFMTKALCYGAVQFLPLAMLADVVDVDSIRTKGERAGSFFALSGMTSKLSIAIGTGVSYNIAGLLGYDASGVAGANSTEELRAMAFQYSIMPGVAYLPAIWLTWVYPLTPQRQARLRALIDRRRARTDARLARVRSAGETGAS